MWKTCTPDPLQNHHLPFKIAVFHVYTKFSDIPKNNIKLVMQYIPFHTHYELLYSHCIPIIFQLYFIVFPLHSYYIRQQSTTDIPTIFPSDSHYLHVMVSNPHSQLHIPTIIHIIISILVLRLYTVYIYIYIHPTIYICYYSYVGYSRYSPDYKLQLD